MCITNYTIPTVYGDLDVYRDYVYILHKFCYFVKQIMQLFYKKEQPFGCSFTDLLLIFYFLTS